MWKDFSSGMVLQEIPKDVTCNATRAPVVRNTIASCIRMRPDLRRRRHRRCAAVRAAWVHVEDAPARAHTKTRADGLPPRRGRTPDASRTRALETERDRRIRSLLKSCARGERLRSRYRKSEANVRSRAETLSHS